MEEDSSAIGLMWTYIVPVGSGLIIIIITHFLTQGGSS